jgi:hypothetical protein
MEKRVGVHHSQECCRDVVSRGGGALLYSRVAAEGRFKPVSRLVKVSALAKNSLWKSCLRTFFWAEA